MTLKEFARTHKEYLVDVNDFEPLSTIGKGGFGEVYKARHKRTGIVCALKRLTFDENQFKDEEKYFVREIDILSRTNNKYLLRLLGFSNHFPYCIATDIISNGSLYDALHHHKKSPNLNGTQLTIIGYVTAYALNSMHESGLIHRDIKAMNVLLDENCLPHICDFGISRTAEKGSTDEIKTGQIGTPNWMAPEILTCEEEYTNKVDIYSYGMMLWEMVTGQVPFAKSQPYSIMAMITKGVRPELPNEAPEGLCELIKACWAQNPDDRPTFVEVMKAWKNHDAAFRGADLKAVSRAIKRIENEKHEANILNKAPEVKPGTVNLAALNPNDPLYESNVITAFKTLQGQQMQQLIDIVFKNPMSENILNAACEVIPKNPEINKFFISQKYFKLIPFANAQLINACSKFYESLFFMKNNVTQSLIEYSVRLSQSLPQIAIEGYYNFLNGSMEIEGAENTINLIVTYFEFYRNCPNTCKILELMKQFLIFKRLEHPLKPTISQLFSSCFVSQVPQTIAALYHCFADIAHFDNEVGRPLDVPVVTNEYFAAHVAYPGITKEVINYMGEVSKYLQLNANIIKTVFVSLKQPDVTAVGYSTLTKLAATEANCAEICNELPILFQEKGNEQSKMNIVLTLAQTKHGKENLTKVPTLANFFLAVIEANNFETISEITTVLQSCQVSHEFVKASANVMFLGYFIRYAMGLNNMQALIKVMCCAVAMVPIEFSQEFIQFIQVIPSFLGSASDPNLKRVSITFLYYLVQYNDAVPHLKNPNLMSCLASSNLSPELAPYANAILQKLR